MNLYEKTVAQLERKEPKHKYILERTPLTDKAKKFFGEFEYSKNTLNSNPDLKRWMESNRKKNGKPFEYIFYYDDPNQTEKQREEEALRHSIDILNRFSNNPLIHGEDYNVTIKKQNIK